MPNSNKEAEIANGDSEWVLYQWRLGVWRVMSAAWSASYLSYGLSPDEITVLVEYYGLLADCLSNIAVALGEDVVLVE